MEKEAQAVVELLFIVGSIFACPRTAVDPRVGNTILIYWHALYTEYTPGAGCAMRRGCMGLAWLSAVLSQSGGGQFIARVSKEA